MAQWRAGPPPPPPGQICVLLTYEWFDLSIVSAGGRRTNLLQRVSGDDVQCVMVAKFDELGGKGDVKLFVSAKNYL